MLELTLTQSVELFSKRTGRQTLQNAAALEVLAASLSLVLRMQRDQIISDVAQVQPMLHADQRPRLLTCPSSLSLFIHLFPVPHLVRLLLLLALLLVFSFLRRRFLEHRGLCGTPLGLGLKEVEVACQPFPPLGLGRRLRLRDRQPR